MMQPVAVQCHAVWRECMRGTGPFKVFNMGPQHAAALVAACEYFLRCQYSWALLVGAAGGMDGVWCTSVLRLQCLAVRYGA
jgi:hypothetical protein